MKKNKGFSLVELIIVIAIMAILAAAIAPALIRYIDKSRKADDIAAAETINTAVQTSMSNEDAYDDIIEAMDGGVIATAGLEQPFVSASHAKVKNAAANFLEEVNSNLSGKAPKLKYRKVLDDTAANWTPGGWAIGCTNSRPIVWITDGTTTNKVEIQPSISKYYK
ncbi:MAG: prepilin-type N-terminal cleavage/methylation domain-containing protein [Eubacterium sp.]|nr:prepilin-type N-terminal cleavage/methylation domain-containing protein [Eubacterium sp.]